VYRSVCHHNGRFSDTPTRSIVISGDIAYSPSLIRPGDADLFVCEVIDLSIYDARMAPRAACVKCQQAALLAICHKH
jgi:ribonuclease BN (tRNA processing enzyme)